METNDLIYLLSCAIRQTTPDAKRIADMDLEALYKLASQHFLAATVAPALKAAGVNDGKFTAAFNSSVLKNATMDNDMDELFKELDAAGIWHMPLKGIVLQHMYPVYGMRQMSDHDILFDADRAEDVKSIFEKLDFEIESYGTGTHDVYLKLPVSNFEMHRMLFGVWDNAQLAAYYQNVETRLMGDGYEKHLSPEDFYLYVTAHEYKHFTGKGTGLRSLLDTFVYLEKNSLDMDYVVAEAEKLGIAGFEAHNRALAQHLFLGEALTEIDQKMLDYILESGVYGTMKHQEKKDMQKKSRFGKIGYALKRFFAPFNRKNPHHITYLLQYSLFYKHKILLPLLPFYRIFRLLKYGKIKSVIMEIKDAEV